MHTNVAQNRVSFLFTLVVSCSLAGSFLIGCPCWEGEVQVFLSPEEAVDAGAQWALDDSPSWYDSETTMANVLAGPHTIYFRTTPGWVAPQSQAVTVECGSHVSRYATYLEAGEGEGCVPDGNGVNDPPQVSLTADPAEGPSPHQVLLTATASDPDCDWLTYTWDYGDGPVVVGQATSLHTYDNEGTFTAKVTVSDGVLVAEATVAVTVAPAPHAEAIIDFESLAPPSPPTDGIVSRGFSYSEDGFTLDHMSPMPGGAEFKSIHPASWRYSDSVSFFNNAQLGITRLTKTGGGSFDFVSIDVDGLNGSATFVPPGGIYPYTVPATFTFIGTLPGGTTVTESFTIDHNFPNRQTYALSALFDNVTRVEWAQDNGYPRPSQQFDNIVVIADAEPIVIVDQSSGQNGNHIQSQDYTDYPVHSVSLFDDFTVASALGLTTLTVFGRDYHGSPANNLDVVAGIYTSPDWTTAPLLSVSGTEVIEEGHLANLEFDFGGAMLEAGTYWLGVYVVRPLSGGYWHWHLRLPITGSQGFWHNPGGGADRGTSPLPLGEVLEEADLAFILNGKLRVSGGTVP